MENDRVLFATEALWAAVVDESSQRIYYRQVLDERKVQWHDPVPEYQAQINADRDSEEASRLMAKKLQQEEDSMLEKEKEQEEAKLKREQEDIALALKLQEEEDSQYQQLTIESQNAPPPAMPIPLPAATEAAMPTMPTRSYSSGMPPAMPPPPLGRGHAHSQSMPTMPPPTRSRRPSFLPFNVFEMDSPGMHIDKQNSFKCRQNNFQNLNS